MEIIVADSYGFCYGVKRAVEMAEESREIPGETYTLGHLIHNEKVVAELAKKGIGSVDTISELPRGANVIIRSHGVGKDVYEAAAEKNANVIDATCPSVKKAQIIAAEFQNKGRRVIIVGDREHPEVKGIAGWAEDPFVINSPEEVDSLPKSSHYGVLCQTTLAQEHFEEVLQELATRSINYEVNPTICLATKQRQEAAIKLAEKVDGMLIIGGLHSANTKHLYDLVKIKCKAWHVDSLDMLEAKMFENIKILGITAGASTPEWLVQDVIEKLKTF